MPKQIPDSEIKKAVNILKQGGLVAFPTDTVYGLGAVASDENAVARVFEVKKRPRSMALPLLVANQNQLKKVVQSISPIAQRLITKFMPGALTLVLYKSNTVLDIVTGGDKTVAVRIPKHPIPIALAKEVGPIVGTSANISSMPSPLTAGEVKAQLGNKLDMILDDGKCPGGKESTVVDVTGEIPVILRQGLISREEIEQIIGKVMVVKGD